MNDELRQDGSTADTLVPVAELLSVLSQTVTLHPGDLLVTGTSARVGSHMSPPRFLAPGDRIEMSIEGLGTLQNTVGQRL